MPRDQLEIVGKLPHIAYFGNNTSNIIQAIRSELSPSLLSSGSKMRPISP